MFPTIYSIVDADTCMMQAAVWLLSSLIPTNGIQEGGWRPLPALLSAILKFINRALQERHCRLKFCCISVTVLMIVVLIVCRVMHTSLLNVQSHTSFTDCQYMSSVITTIRLLQSQDPKYIHYVQYTT